MGGDITPYEERDTLLAEACRWQLRCERARAERDAARAEVAALKARAAHLEYAASGVGCRMLSQGEGCQCRLCELERRAEQAEAEVARLREALESARAWTEAYRPLSELRALIDAALAGPHDNTPAVTVQGLP